MQQKNYTHMSDDDKPTSCILFKNLIHGIFCADFGYTNIKPKIFVNMNKIVALSNLPN